MIELPLDDQAWHDFVLGRKEATAFHHPFWALLLAECYGLTGHVLAIEDTSGGIRAGIPVLEPNRLPFSPTRWVSLPFTDALPPLVDGADAATFTLALEAQRGELGIERIELRGPLPGTRPYPATFVSHELTLDSDPDVNARAFHSSVKRNIKTATRHGIVVRRMESEAELLDTYFRLHVATRRRLGVPSQPRRFFELLWRRGFEQGHGFGLLAWHGTSAIAGAVFLEGNRSVIYKFGASDSASWRLRPNNVLLAEALRIAATGGYTRFDFGRSELSAEGLRSFKRGWGAAEGPLEYCSLGSVPTTSVGGGGRIAGAVLRASPTWVTRAVGAVLYRYVS
jgi:CelD/BcsL family acetyltransferase involved in cellulose biosynthesis